MQDLLTVEDDMITFQSDGKGGRHETKALLNDADALWVEFRHQHIAKVFFFVDWLIDRWTRPRQTKGEGACLHGSPHRPT